MPAGSTTAGAPRSSASANFVYTFERSGKPCFLRFAEESERRREDVVAEIDIVRSLADMGSRVASPVPSMDSRLVETVTTGSGTFHVTDPHPATVARRHYAR
ncbi:MAG: hypothetical protein M3395_00495 [Chloroflexota bacterium]|nr:hypothetical protein [Chloroflexota bacterium]